MIELDGVQYNVRTPAENAQEMITYINDYCSTNNILNSKGELVQIEINHANPLYMICYGFGYLASILQKLVYNAGCALNISRSSNRQLMNLAEIANVKRKAATRTTVPVMIYSNIQETTGAVPCPITLDLVVSYTYGSQTITFSPAFETTIPIGGSQYMVLICNEEGSYSIPAGAITSFDENPVGFRSMSNFASVPGQDEESYASLRARIQERATTATQLDRAAADISQLPGVSLCNIYFNYSNINSTVVGGITVPPRQSVLFVQGFSSDIARTFYNHLSCLTAGSDYQYAIQQNYVTHAGQSISVYIIPPTVVYVYINIYIGSQVVQSVNQGIKDAICSLSSSLTIGQSLTSTMVIDKIMEAYPNLDLQGVELSLTGADGTFTYVLDPQPQQLFGFNVDNMILPGNVE